MLERRAGEDTFKRVLQRIVARSCHPAAAQGAHTRAPLPLLRLMCNVCPGSASPAPRKGRARAQTWVVLPGVTASVCCKLGSCGACTGSPDEAAALQHSPAASPAGPTP